MFYRNSSGDFARLEKGTAGQVLQMNSGATAPEWADSSSDGVTISNNVNNRVLTGDGTNANAETNLTFTGSALNVVGTISCDTSLTIDSSILDASDILHISDITAGTATARKALVIDSMKSISGITSLGTGILYCPTISTSSNADLQFDPSNSGVVVFKGNSTRGSGQIKLNCENNSHGITIKGPPHSAGATYTLTLPNNDGDADQVLKTDGSGNLSWTTSSGGGGGVTMNGSTSNGMLTYNSSNEATVESQVTYNSSNGLFYINNAGPELRLRSYTADSVEITMVSDAGGEKGDGYQMKSADGTFTIASDHNTIGVYDELMITCVGHDDETYKTTTITGNLNATQDITAYSSSDRRFKNNIEKITDPLEKLEKINGYTFVWKDGMTIHKGKDIGMIAQEVEKVIPEVTITRSDGYKAIKYEKIAPFLIECIKEQQKTIKSLKEKVLTQNDEYNTLKERIEQLESYIFSGNN